MAKQTINIGTAPNARNGDPLRTAFTKINANFTELYATASADVQIPAQSGNNGKFLTTDGTSLSWTNYTPNLVNGNYYVTLDANGLVNLPISNNGNAYVQTTAPNIIFNTNSSLTTLSQSGLLSTSKISLSGTGTALNIGQGNILTNQITGTQLNFLSGAYTVTLATSGTTASYTLNLPTTAGTANQYLKTDGSGNLSWSSISSSTNALTNGSYSFTLQSQGYLTVPTSQYSTAQMFSNAGVDFYIGTLDSGNYWQFRTSGRLTFPDNTTQTTAYTGLATASTSVLGGVKVDGTSITINGSGVISSAGGGDGVKYAGALDAYSADFTITTQQLVLVTNNGVTNRNITLPASPSEGRTVTIKNTSAFASWGITVIGNGANIEGSSSNYSLPNTNGRAFATFVYSAVSTAGAGWWLVGKG